MIRHVNFATTLVNVWALVFQNFEIPKYEYYIQIVAKIFFNLKPHTDFEIFPKIWLLTFLLFASLFLWRAMSKTIRLFALKVWTHVPRITEMDWLIQ